MKPLIFLLLFCWTIPIYSQNIEAADKTLSPYFLVSGNSGKEDALPLKSTHADVNIAGVIADVWITQTYVNTGKQPLEAVYVFPASTNAAVYAMEMQVGQRVIKAKIDLRQKAREDYEKARSEGKRASLLEQERPNVFQMNVANIMPNDTIRVSMRYTELLVPEEGIYSFVYPTVVGPRYENGVEKGFANASYGSQGQPPTFDFGLNLHLSAGMPIRDITCPTHPVQVQHIGPMEANVHLSGKERKGGNRDFVLNYVLRGDQIETGMLLFDDGKEKFFLCMAQPPKRIEKSQLPPREYIFVVDVSGSMNGFPLDVSKKLLRNLISSLAPQDRFNVVLFAAASDQMSETSLPGTPKNIERAMAVIDGQQGSGGTELLPALQKALNLPRQSDGLSRSVILVTDGYIAADTKCIDLVRANLNRCNVFAFGIGTSINRYLMEGIAHAGAGRPFFLEKPNEAEQIAKKFRKYVSSPVLSEISTRFDGFDAYDLEPMSLPDVMSDRPVLFFGKWKGKPKGKIHITGFSGDQPLPSDNAFTSAKGQRNGKARKVSITFEVNKVQPDARNAALKYLWARERIRYMDDYKAFGTKPEFEELTAQLGLKYNLLTAYTSFVAIEETPVNANAANLKKVVQPLPLPNNVSDLAVGFDLNIDGITGLPSAGFPWAVLMGFILVSVLVAGIFRIRKSAFPLLLMLAVGLESCRSTQIEIVQTDSVCFLLGDDQGVKNPYFAAAKSYFTQDSLEKNELVVQNCQNLREVRDFLASKRPENRPWHRVNLVVHGNQWSGIRVPLAEGQTSRTNAALLQSAIREGHFPPPPNVAVDNTTEIVVHGCQVGRDTALLQALSEAFGGATVRSAPFMNVFEVSPDAPGQYRRYLSDFYHTIFPAGAYPGNAIIADRLRRSYPDVPVDWKNALCNLHPKKYSDPYVHYFFVSAKWTFCFPDATERPQIPDSTGRCNWVRGQAELMQQIEATKLQPEQFNWRIKAVKVPVPGQDSVAALKVEGYAIVYGVMKAITPEAKRSDFAQVDNPKYYTSVEHHSIR